MGAEDPKALPSPLYVLQDLSIQVAREMLEDTMTPPDLRKSLLTDIWDRTGLGVTPPPTDKSSGTVPIEMLSAALGALASQVGVATSEPIELKGVLVEDIPTSSKRKPKKTRKAVPTKTLDLLTSISEPDPDDA